MGRICAAAVFGWGAAGGFGPLGLPVEQQIGFTITLMAALMWMTEAVPLFVTSLLVLFLSLAWLQPALDAVGRSVPPSVFTGPFFSDVILLFLGGFVLAAGLKRQSLDLYAAAILMRMSGSSLRKLLLVSMATTAFLSMWLSNTAATAMMLTLMLPLVHQLPTGASARTALLLGIPFSANIGGLGTPIGSPPNAIALQYLRDINAAPSFGVWVLIGFPGVIGMIGFSWGVLTTMFQVKGQVEPTNHNPIEIKWNRPTLLVLAVTASTILLWLTTDWHGYRSGVVALIPVLLFFGSGLLGVAELRNLSWDVLLLMGGGLCLGEVLATSGFAGTLVSWLPTEELSVYGTMVFFGCTACLLSSVMSNTATANLILPVAASLSLEPMRPILIGIAFACTLAMPLPVSTPPNALVFSSGELRLSDLQKAGSLITIAGCTLAFTTGWWWWKLWGLF
ncbi:SLC13 family permease [Rubinisphaera margarita]|uniref:SLC13 family permease n=1 Tax=Rubinisphaera margarita TaxID=2909586 RepID=UPI001EE81F7C|nr:DASS family sodium-coupled anion symporter [Rubinisphaera margarita]MCG6156526.1 DASS family sodium-coupled anion symporter [Rubinisphaera margarita]